MSSSTATKPAFQTTAIAQSGSASAVAKRSPRRIKWSEFEKRYLRREDGYTYEWVEGLVEKTYNTMNPAQLFIQRNLIALFRALLNVGKVNGELLAEPDLFFAREIHRRPDMAWLTNAQIDRLATEGAIEIPAFLIEVISTNDAAQKIVDKMRQYREAGVQVVWLIYPAQQEVHVYAGANLDRMTVCTGEKICSAAPVLPDFAVAVQEVFRKGEE
ncbi:MAG: Uma2 family endonuclease [Saprospiraceae bacterium]|jgi:Uma2 family endonuclease|nr:Uma2 family endonuclease [Saprospiraceae bacterium]